MTPAQTHIKLFSAFREAGAVGEEIAKTLDEIGTKLTPFIKERLLKKPLELQISKKKDFC